MSLVIIGIPIPKIFKYKYIYTDSSKNQFGKMKYNCK